MWCILVSFCVFTCVFHRKKPLLQAVLEMSEGHFESALRSLQKPQDSKRLLQILVIIRKEIEWPRNKDNMLKLRDNGCLKPIVSCLNIQNGNILDVVLSIIGNCCMERNSARDLVRQADLAICLINVNTSD